MKDKMRNAETISGYVYQHELKEKTVENTESSNYGKPFIGGKIDIATDEDCLNVISVNFTYVTETTNKGSKNNTYTALKKIIDEGKTVIEDGVENATKVQIDTSLGLNDFYKKDSNDEFVLVSAKKNDGGFVKIVDKLGNKRNTFDFDIVILNAERVEADEDKHIDEDFVKIHGIVFDFKKAALPVDLVCKDPRGMEYFENLCEDGEPIFTEVWGTINSTIIKTQRTTETAWGEDRVDTQERTVKEWIITEARKEPYDFGDEKYITETDLEEAKQARETYLAEVKEKQNTYEEKKKSNGGFADAVKSSSPKSEAAAKVKKDSKWKF